MIPEGAIEAAARAMVRISRWDDVAEGSKAQFRADARRALEAAAPHMWDVVKAYAYAEGFEVAGDRPPAFNPYRSKP